MKYVSFPTENNEESDISYCSPDTYLVDAQKGTILSSIFFANHRVWYEKMYDLKVGKKRCNTKIIFCTHKGIISPKKFSLSQVIQSQIKKYQNSPDLSGL